MVALADPVGSRGVSWRGVRTSVFQYFHTVVAPPRRACVPEGVRLETWSERERSWEASRDCFVERRVGRCHSVAKVSVIAGSATLRRLELGHGCTEYIWIELKDLQWTFLLKTFL